MPTLKELSIALGLLTSEHSAAVDVDGWQGYVWRVRDIEHCTSLNDEPCKLLEDRWDWKRPQTYQFSLQVDTENNTVVSRIGLMNDDSSDRDNVCIVAAFLDKRGRRSESRLSTGHLPRANTTPEAFQYDRSGLFQRSRKLSSEASNATEQR